jgi:hypothetical protein
MLCGETVSAYCGNRTEHSPYLTGNTLRLRYKVQVGKQSLFTVRTVRNTQIHINSVSTSPETHHVSATEPNRLMLCKICDFHVNNYEECGILGYKNPVRTSQETHVSATESSRLMPFWETVAVYCENYTEHTDTL